jgi:hypothetical protein
VTTEDCNIMESGGGDKGDVFRVCGDGDQ